MAVAERFRMRTPAGRDDGQVVLPRGFETVGVWGLLSANGLFGSVLLGRTLRQAGATGGRHTGCEAACSDSGSMPRWRRSDVKGFWSLCRRYKLQGLFEPAVCLV